MKKIMILGAGIYQLPLIKTAKSLGYYVCVSSIEGNYPGFAVADKIFYTNTTDYESILKICIEEKIDAICTTGTDVAIKTVGYVCEKLNLHGLSEKSALLATNKASMKEAFKNGGVSTARHCIVYNIEDAIREFESFSSIAVLKVVDKSGSRGVIKVQSLQELKTAYKLCMKITNQDYLILEEFIEGMEIGIDAMIQNGSVNFILPHKKIVYQTENTCIPMGHIFPFECHKDTLKKIEIETKKTIEALKLNNCAVNVDAFITKEGKVYIIEAGGRAGATGIPECISMYLNNDYYNMILNCALGIQNSTHLESNRFSASYLIFPNKTGKLIEVDVPSEFKDLIEWDIPLGSNVRKSQNGTDRIGQLILCANSKAELERKLHLCKEIQLIIEEV